MFICLDARHCGRAALLWSRFSLLFSDKQISQLNQSALEDMPAVEGLHLRAGLAGSGSIAFEHAAAHFVEGFVTAYFV